MSAVFCGVSDVFCIRCIERAHKYVYVIFTCIHCRLCFCEKVVCMYIYIYIYIYTHTYTYVCVCVCMCSGILYLFEYEL